MRYPNQDAIIWQFDTAEFRIVCHVEEEFDNPEGHFASGDADLDAESVAFCRQGGAHWFCAFVSVWRGNDEDSLEYLAHDCLGGCSYNSFREFVSGHRDRNPEHRNTLAMKARNRATCHYFPDMVRTAIAEARRAMAPAKAARIESFQPAV